MWVISICYKVFCSNRRSTPVGTSYFGGGGFVSDSPGGGSPGLGQVRAIYTVATFHVAEVLVDRFGREVLNLYVL